MTVRISVSPHFEDQFGGAPTAEASQTGAKGAGLLRLPAEWYPPSIFIDGCTGGEDLAQASGELLNHYVTLLNSDTLLARSNMPDENIDDRGKFSSLECSSDYDSVLLSSGRVIDDALQLGESQAGVILQKAIPALLKGHASNAYRSSREATSWTVEIWRGGSSEERVWQVGQLSVSVPHMDSRNPAAALGELRKICRRLSDRPYRVHLEWVWDGDRLWIVQADQVQPVRGAAPGDMFRPTIGRLVRQSELQVWQSSTSVGTDQASRWGKLRAPQVFASAGSPTVDVWFAAGADIQQNVDRSLRELQAIASGHVVIRVDISDHKQHLNLPRSSPISSPLEAQRWCLDQLDQLTSDGAAAEDVGFFIHRYLRARAAAWALATPETTRVQVDCLWGTAGGLDWLPHDSNIVDPAVGSIARSTRGKVECEDVSPAGVFQYRNLPSEWIWRAAASDDQLRLIATGSQAVATRLGHPVVIMWFVGLLDDGPADCIPWMYIDATELHAEEAQSIGRTRPRVTIRTIDDLEGADSWQEDCVVRVESGASVLRNKAFIERLSNACSSRGVPVELLGSTLAHPYFELRRAGIVVTSVGHLTSGSGVVRHGKMVRDAIPERIASRGQQSEQRTLSANDRKIQLRRKLVEEAFEVFWAQSEDELTEEIADVTEVIEAIRSTYKITRESVRVLARDKRARLGGFDSGVYLIRSARHLETPNQGQPTLPGFDGLHLGVPDLSPVQSGAELVVSLIPPSNSINTWGARLGPLAVQVGYDKLHVTLTPKELPSPEPTIPGI